MERWSAFKIMKAYKFYGKVKACSLDLWEFKKHKKITFGEYISVIFVRIHPLRNAELISRFGSPSLARARLCVGFYFRQRKYSGLEIIKLIIMLKRDLHSGGSVHKKASRIQ